MGRRSLLPEYKQFLTNIVITYSIFLERIRNYDWVIWQKQEHTSNREGIEKQEGGNYVHNIEGWKVHPTQGNIRLWYPKLQEQYRRQEKHLYRCSTCKAMGVGFFSSLRRPVPSIHPPLTHLPPSICCPLTPPSSQLPCWPLCDPSYSLFIGASFVVPFLYHFRLSLPPLHNLHQLPWPVPANPWAMRP